MQIINASTSNSKAIAKIVSESNIDVAEKFNLNIQNTPKHPSFCTDAWVKSDFERGEKYFLAVQGSQFMGCVAYESPNPSLSYLNRLSVLPKFRRRGIGEILVKHVIEYSRVRGTELVSIGIIAKFTELKNWYIKLGFVEGETKSFEHLPFEVMYLSFKIEC